jgi:hypothetical protein
MRRENGASHRPAAGSGTLHFDFFFCPAAAGGGWT